jgi:hypothetical protein
MASPLSSIVPKMNCVTEFEAGQSAAAFSGSLICFFTHFILVAMLETVPESQVSYAQALIP